MHTENPVKEGLSTDRGITLATINNNLEQGRIPRGPWTPTKSLNELQKVCGLPQTLHQISTSVFFPALKWEVGWGGSLAFISFCKDTPAAKQVRHHPCEQETGSHMAQILLDLFSDFSDFYPTFLFKIGSQSTRTQAQGSLARGMW